MNPVVAEMLLISGKNLIIYLGIGTTGLLIGAALAFLLIRLRWAKTESESIPGPIDLKQLKEDVLGAIREPLLEMQKSFGRMEGVISSSRTHEETCAANNAEIKTHISTAISNLSQTVANLPEAINNRFLESLHEEERKRKEEELKRQEQEKKKYEEECERTKQSVKESFYSRLATLQEGSHALKIAVLTRDVFEGLDTAVSNREKLRESFRAYFALVQRADTFRKKITDFAGTPNAALQNAESELEKEFQSLEAEANSLEESHRVIWFVSLLEQANRNRSLDEKVHALRTLLGLEEINILPGHEIKGLDEVDVVSTDGLGSRTIISEVLERGYKERGTGLLVSKPKVRVRLQS